LSDEEHSDPDYNFLSDPFAFRVDVEEYRNDRAVKIPRNFLFLFFFKKKS